MDKDAMWDLLIIGGGINGAGLARDAAGRGMSVLLCEQDDLASGTSSASSKLIHGGLRYLEYFEFRLVREALAEREVLLRLAPHLIRPLRFVLPFDRSMRPAWLIRLGLFFYDHLSRRRLLEGSRGVKLRRHRFGAPLKERIARGFAFSDCWVDDSRLVVLNAMDAARLGATVRTRTRCGSARRRDGHWSVDLHDALSGASRTVRARALVNAAGPWVDLVMRKGLGKKGYRHLTLIKGSHIVVPRVHEGEQAYILQHSDRRVVFVIPFLEQYTLIGTTELPFDGDPAIAECKPPEVDYLCAAVNRYWKRPVSPSDVVWSFAGVRPLYDDASGNPSAVSREYVVELDCDGAEAPLVSIIGGKITAYRQVAEQAMEHLAPFFPGLRPSWTGTRPLPGGDMPGGDLAGLMERLRSGHPGIPAKTITRLGQAYGTLAETLLDGVESPAGLGRCFGADLHQREVEHLMEREWALTAADVLWRRSKLGLEFSKEEADRLERWMGKRRGRAESGSRGVALADVSPSLDTG